MSVNAFLKIKEIPGESQQEGHTDEIELSAWNFGATQHATAQKAGGVGAGKATFDHLTITKYIDKASPLFLANCAAGAHIKEAVLTLYKATGQSGAPAVYTTVTIHDFMIANYSISGNDDGGAIEVVNLAFTKVEFEYKPQKADGSLGAAAKRGWDLKTNKAT